MRGLLMNPNRTATIFLLAGLALTLGAAPLIAQPSEDDLRPVLSMELEELAARLGSIGALPVQLFVQVAHARSGVCGVVAGRPRVADPSSLGAVP